MQLWDAFHKGFRFAGKQLPVSIRPESMEQIQAILTQRLVELKQKVA